MAIGRPPSFTKEIGDEICERLAQGESLRAICKSDHIPVQSVIYRWLIDERYASFKEQYTRARELQADTLFDEIIDIADDGTNDWMTRNGEEVLNNDHLQRSRLRIDSRKWMAGKLRPKVYGDKIGLTDGDGGPLQVVIQKFEAE